MKENNFAKGPVWKCIVAQAIPLTIAQLVQLLYTLLRKAFIVVPLTVILPMVGFGVNGVFLAEPISNVIGGL